MDDRFQLKCQTELLPDETTYGISYSSRVSGTVVDYVGWRVSTVGVVTVEYSDKQQKLPTVTLTRYPHASSAMPTHSIPGCVNGRFVEIRRATARNENGPGSYEKFLEGAKETLTQIAARKCTFDHVKGGLTMFVRNNIVPHHRAKLLKQLAIFWHQAAKNCQDNVRILEVSV